MYPMSESEKRFEGNRFKVYYLPVDDFIPDLEYLGRCLEGVNDRGEEVVSVVPNTGFVKSSLLLGASFQGVKGFAVVTRKS